jgi:dihydroxyacetone kinase-like protein
MLEAMLVSISTTGGAKLGDKTLVDALEPAARSAEAAARQSRAFSEALSEAAEAGSQRTVEMVAAKRRRSYLGERSKGRADLGAAFIALFLRSMTEGIRHQPEIPAWF